MGSSPITSWQIDEETMETATDFIFLGSKIIAHGNYSHEIKICLLLGRKALTNLNSVLKSRDITLLTKVHIVKAMLFPVVMYECAMLNYPLCLTLCDPIDCSSPGSSDHENFSGKNTGVDCHALL